MLGRLIRRWLLGELEGRIVQLEIFARTLNQRISKEQP